MGISYSTYIGPYFYCSKQSYKEWEGELRLPTVQSI